MILLVNIIGKAHYNSIFDTLAQHGFKIKKYTITISRLS